MIKIKTLIVILLFGLSAIAVNIQGLNASSENVNNTTFPLGTASLDYQFLMTNQLTTAGSTSFGDQTGKTLYYNLNVNKFPLVSVLNSLYGTSASSIFQSFSLANTQFFIKVLRQEGNMMDMVAGIKLGNGLSFNLTPVFNSNAIPAFLKNLVIPSGLTGIFPYNINSLNNPFSESTNTQCSYYYYCYYPTLVSPLGLYINPTNFTGAYNAISNQLNTILQSSNTSSTNWLDYTQYPWPANSGIYNPSSSPYNQYYYVETTVMNGKISFPVPITGINNGVFNASTYDFNYSPYSQSSSAFFYNYNIPELNNNYQNLISQKITSISVPNEFYNNTGIYYIPLPDGTPVVVSFQPDQYIYANGNMVYIPQMSISHVYGVYSQQEIGNVYSVRDIPSSATNYYSGGAILNQHNITLAITPNPNTRLVVFYSFPNSQVVSSSTQYVPGTTFNFGLNISSSNPQMANFNAKVIYNVNTGWMSEIDLKLGIDANNDSYIDPNSEVFDFSIVYNSSASYQTVNPLKIGDTGSYTIAKSNLNINLDPVWQNFWDSTMTNSTTQIQTFANNLQGKKLLDYQVSGVDGLYYSLQGNIYNPTKSNDPVLSPYYPNTTTFNAFNGFYAFNQTNPSVSMSWLNFNQPSQVENYYNTIFPSAPISWTTSTYGSAMVVENITITNSNLISLSLPHQNEVYYFNKSDYNFNLPTWEQNSTSANMFNNYYTINSENQLNTTYSNFPLGSQWVFIYYPDNYLNVINGQVYIPTNLQLTGVSSVYYNEYNSYYFNNPSGYYVGRPLYTSGSSFSGNVITLSGMPSGMYHVSATVNMNNLANHRLYSLSSLTALGMVVPTLTNPFGYIAPARTAGADFNFMQNDVNFVNSLSQTYLPQAESYLQNYINTNLANSFYKNMSLAFSFTPSFTSNSSGYTLLYNAAGSTFLPVKLDNNLFTVDTDINITGKAGMWVQWDNNGILKQIGLNLHLAINSNAIGSTSTTPIASSKSTSTITASPGFEYIAILFCLPIVVISRIRSRKN